MKENLEEMALYLDHIPGLVVIDMNGVIIYANDQCANYFGTTKEEMLGKHIKKDIFPATKMIENIHIDEPQMVFYNSRMGIGISVHVPIFRGKKRMGLLEYDVMQHSRQLYELSDGYRRFLDKELKNLKMDLSEIESLKYSINSIIGQSAAILELKEEIINAAQSSSTVVITGETGTGKELVAHSIHNLSSRREKKMVKVNASAFPENLVESEFFGYEEGSFTGASRHGKKGKFEQANGGTLFIDEINHMPLSIQPKLLRVLQEKEIERIGGTDSIPVDVRILAATNENLKDLVTSGRFREDLYYRLNVMEILIPPLRQRIEDIDLLIHSKIQELNCVLGKSVSGIHEDALKMLKGYKWPGNVRELYNVIERAMNYSKGPLLTIKDFNIIDLRDMELHSFARGAEEKEDLISITRNEAEAGLIVNVLERFKGNKTKSADFLGISRPLLYQKMKRLGIKL